jgi:hypothetical protein
MTPTEFIKKWRAANLKERSAAQEHFLDLCRVLADRFCRKVRFLGKIQKSGIRNSMTYRLPSSRKSNFATEPEKLKADQQARLEKTLLEYIPKLVGAKESERKTAIAVLFILYPNDAKVMLDRTTASLSDEQKTMLQPTVQQAEALAAKTGAWSIVMGSDATVEGAQFEATQARKQGYTPAVIYQQEKWFVTTVGSYPNQEAAMSDTIAVRSKLRSSAFPVNVKSWCTNPVDQGGYVACGAK